MNGQIEPECLPAKQSTSPRPPTAGREVRLFHEDYSWYKPEHYKRTEDLDFVYKTEKIKMLPQKEQVANTSCKEPSPNPSPSSPYKWAESLECLLDDHNGANLFNEFLIQEGHDLRCLHFFFACRGFKKTDPSDISYLKKLTRAIFDKNVKRNPCISSATKSEIQDKVATKSVDVNIFDRAEKEVEDHWRRAAYPNFLKSDLYIQQLGQHEPVCDRESASDHLPTVHEDSELTISEYKTQNLRNSILERRSLSQFRSRTEVPAGLLKSPYSFSTKYAPFLPASAQDSELQSISSGAQTDDTTSQADSSIDYPMHRNKQKQQQKYFCGGVLNKDRLSHNDFIPRTQRAVPVAEGELYKNPTEFHAVLVKKLHRVIEDQKTKEKVNDRLKSIEGYDCSKRLAAPPSQSQELFQFQPVHQNDQDILDEHVSRVFEDTGLTPTLSPACASPPAVKPLPDIPPAAMMAQNAQAEPQDLAYSTSQKIRSPFSVPCSFRYRRDHDTRSNDSGALTDWVSEDNLPSSCHRSVDYGQDPMDLAQVKRVKEQLKRFIGKKTSSLADSSSCVDSGVSVACESVPSHSKVTHWLESRRCASETEREWKNSSTSPVLSRSSSSRKPVAYNSSRSGVLDAGTTHWPLAASQASTHDPTPEKFEVTKNLMEARRRLEQDDGRPKSGKSKSTGRNSHETTRLKMSFRACDTVEDGISHRKQSKKSCPSTVDSTTSSVTLAGNNDVTIIGYSYGRGSVPYKSRIPGKNVTLKQFKSLLNKKGNFRYFFKRISDDFGTGVVLEEVTDDYEVLPLWEGKVFCVIESMDDNGGSMMNDE